MMQRVLHYAVATVELLGSLASIAGLGIALQLLRQEQVITAEVSTLKREEEDWHKKEA